MQANISTKLFINAQKDDQVENVEFANYIIF